MKRGRGLAVRQPADRHLGGALGRAHHVGRVDRLVGADQHEALDAGLGAAPAPRARCRGCCSAAPPRRCPPPSAARACRRRRGRRAAAATSAIVAAQVRRGPSRRRSGASARRSGKRSAERLVDRVQVELALLEQHQPRRPVPGDLPAQLAADAAAGAGDEHRLAADQRRRRRSRRARPARGRAGPRARSRAAARSGCRRRAARRSRARSAPAGAVAEASSIARRRCAGSSPASR